MGVFQNIVASASGLVRNVGEAIDRNVTTEAEKMQLFNELQRILNEQQKEITSRHAADMASDSWLSKNVRPITLIGLLILYLLFALLDGLNVLHLQVVYIDILEQLCILVLTFYFGSRGIEKVMYNVTKNRHGK